MRAVEINALVKMFNQTTEHADKLAEHEAELAQLRAETGEGRAATNVTIRRIQAIRNDCCDVDKRRALAEELNANPSYNRDWRFAVRNGRLMVDPR